DLDPVPAEQLVLLHHAHTGGGQVVLVGGHGAGMLGGLTTDERAPGRLAAQRDAGADLGDLVRLDLPAGDVVEQEQRLGAAGDDVVDDHRHQVQPDRVMDVHGLGDEQLGPHAVGGGRQDRVAVLGGVQPEQSREAAEVAEHLWTAGPV